MKFKSLRTFLTCFFVSGLKSVRGSRTSALHLPINDNAYLDGVGLGSLKRICDKAVSYTHLTLPTIVGV